MNNTAFILTLAYPDTIVRISDEKLLRYLRYFKIGTKNYVRAGHAALVLIDKFTGELEYFDFGRYTAPVGYGRVRAKETDNELEFPLKAEIKNNSIVNLDEILVFLATNPKLTHGEGKLIASVCSEIDYDEAKQCIFKTQQQEFVRYGAFKKQANNCSRFVTDVLIASVTNKKKNQQLVKSTWFTPSTVSNVMISNTETQVYQISEIGVISKFMSTSRAESRRCFLDSLPNFKTDLFGNIKPKPVEGLNENAQWLGGIGAGAWFELLDTSSRGVYRYRRISPYGQVDVDDYFKVDDTAFNFKHYYEFVYYSNCKFFHVKQNGSVYRFDRQL